VFIRNKYRRWYYQIIDRARQRGKPNEYYEKHHVIPKCMGGKNDFWNIVNLTFREHYLVHWLLTKFVKDKKMLRSINWSLVRMVHQFNVEVIPSRWYEKAKQAARKAQLGITGVKRTEETRENIRKSLLGKKLTAYHCERLSKSHSKIYIGYLGEMMTIREAVNTAGNIVSVKCAGIRIKKGWPHREAVETPKQFLCRKINWSSSQIMTEGL